MRDQSFLKSFILAMAGALFIVPLLLLLIIVHEDNPEAEFFGEG